MTRVFRTCCDGSGWRNSDNLLLIALLASRMRDRVSSSQVCGSKQTGEEVGKKAD